MRAGLVYRIIIVLVLVGHAHLATFADEPEESDPRADFIQLLNAMAAMSEEASKQQGTETRKAFSDLKKLVEEQGRANKQEGRGSDASKDPFAPMMAQITGLLGGSVNVLQAMAKDELQQQNQNESTDTSRQLSGKAAFLALHGKADEAINIYQKALEQDPENSAAFYGIASVYARKGMTKQALVALEKAIAFDDKYVSIAKRDASFASLLTDPQFKAIVGTAK